MAAPMSNKIFQFSRVPWHPSLVIRNFHANTSPLLFHATPLLCSAPVKKKKKIDPAMVIGRMNKKKRQIEKEIRKFEKQNRECKPIDELSEYVNFARSQVNGRKRENSVLSFDECEERALLYKEWGRFKSRQHHYQLGKVYSAMAAQQEALTELRNESEELYQQAIQLDESLIPYNFTGITRTPPIEDYDSPDGDYQDVSKVY